MSLKTWKAEFYPVPAGECPTGKEVEHSLLKWEGLRPENLAKHKLRYQETQGLAGRGANAETFKVNSASCALCDVYFYSDTGGFCGSCPLTKAREGFACDRPDEKREHVAPWQAWSGKQDPEPMIMWLKRALAEKE